VRPGITHEVSYDTQEDRRTGKVAVGTIQSA
jgi:hypothetical protein